MKRHCSPGQGRAHVQGVGEPDEAENAQPDGNVDEDLTNGHSYLLFLLGRNWWFLFLLRASLSIYDDVPLPLPSCICVGLPEIEAQCSVKTRTNSHWDHVRV